MNAKERGSIEIDTLHKIIDALTYYELINFFVRKTVPQRNSLKNIVC